MLKKVNGQFLFIRNCLVIYVVVGFFASLMADSHKSFLLSSQSYNASQFSRIISLTVAHQARENLYK
ncbi:hypothetical protein [Geminocystis sp. NIES-3709]|uniref:hypothetical protein n=1 Tax=Geminocystis sp. NIES-3709 TaxID=1617448 RepID=UPI0005FC4A65|nr:hypothetical protein [Geminocystis sp. NIES-3709]BAQ66387.1 hypothetical protein GM3709_3152 [Geminocystis sp. NIES-3709]